jgi:hypothetical protein
MKLLISKTNDYSKALYLKLYHENLSTSFNKNIPHVYHYGINPDIINQIYFPPKRLHPVEEYLYLKAYDLEQLTGFEELKRNQETYANNVITVDLIPRDKVMIHCTTLWKIKPKTYIILVPNQPSFSFPLIELMKKLIPDIDLILFNNPLYNSENYEEKRDCLDLSIKIGLEINLKQNYLKKEEVWIHIVEMFCNNCKRHLTC